MRVLLAGAVHDNVEPPKPLHRLGDHAAGDVFLADVAHQQLALPALFADEAAGFVCVVVFFEIGDCNVGPFLRREYRNGTADAAVAPRDQQDAVLESIRAPRLGLALRLRRQLTLAPRLTILVLRRQRLRLAHAPRCTRALHA